MWLNQRMRGKGISMIIHTTVKGITIGVNLLVVKVEKIIVTISVSEHIL